jgi:hypothetical protein
MTMKVRIFIPLLLSLGCSAFSFAQSVPNATEARLTRPDVRQQIQTAHNPQQYQALADYFRLQEKSFRAKAAAEKLVWDARSQNIAATGNKYPRPVDSAHYLYDSYSYDADQSRQKAEHYEQLAAHSTTSAPSL